MFYYKYRKHLTNKKEAAAKIEADQAENGEKNTVENVENDNQVKEKLEKENDSVFKNAQTSSFESIETTDKSIENCNIDGLVSPKSLSSYHTLNNQKPSVFKNRILPLNSNRPIRPPFRFSIANINHH